jgi:hypothetical protein
VLESFLFNSHYILLNDAFATVQVLKKQMEEHTEKDEEGSRRRSYYSLLEGT